MAADLPVGGVAGRHVARATNRGGAPEATDAEISVQEPRHSWFDPRRYGTGKAIVILVYILLSLSGTTLSSVGINSLRQTPAHSHGIQLGVPRPVRSDEWLTYTPIELGVMAAGSTSSATPLSQEPDIIYQIPSGGVIESVVFADGLSLRLGRILPDAMVFAAYWWLPTLLLSLTLPGWLRRLGATPRMAWLALGLIVICPASAWWSLMPVRVLSYAVAGCVCAMSALEQWIGARRVRAIALAVLGGIFLARLPTYYVVWSFTIGVPVVLATFVWLLFDRERRRAAFAISFICGAVALLLFAGIALENSAALRAELNTVYPGLRRDSSLGLGIGTVFGAPALYTMQHKIANLSSSNQSELSSGFTIAAVWSLVIWLPMKRRKWTRENAAVAVIAAATVFWLVWCLVTLGPWSASIPIANRVPPVRAAQTVGMLAVMVLAVVLSRATRPTSVKNPAIAAGVCTGITALAGSNLQLTALPGMSSGGLIAASLVVGVVVFVVTSYPDKWQSVVLTLLAAACTVFAVNPVIVGLGDLRGTDISRYMLAQGGVARQDKGYWASDSIITDGLLVSTGVPALTGHQVTGPVDSQWRKLDPTGRYEKSWNRGSSYVEMNWSSDQTPVITNPGFDQILVSVDPCAVPRLGLNLTYIVSPRALTQSCLSKVHNFSWSGIPEFVYKVG